MKLHTIIDGRLYQSGKWPSDVVKCELEIGLGGITDFVSVWRPYPWLKKRVQFYYHCPLPDGRNIPFEQLLPLVDALTVRLKAGAHMVVACHAGRNRSGLVNALLVRQWYGLSGKEAMSWVRNRRLRALANPVFEEYLQGLPGVPAVATTKELHRVLVPRDGMLL